MKTNALGMAALAVIGVVLLGAGADPGVAHAAGEGGSEGPPSRRGDSSSRREPEPRRAAARRQDAGRRRDAHVHVGQGPSTPAPIEAVSERRVPAPGWSTSKADYCPHVEQKCLRWLDPEISCAARSSRPVRHVRRQGPHKHFCIDRYEYPNKPGAKPVVMETGTRRKRRLRGEGKRLCGDSEWTLACEGQERLPYPYGYARNADACNIDKPHPDVDEAAIADPRDAPRRRGRPALAARAQRVARGVRQPVRRLRHDRQRRRVGRERARQALQERPEGRLLGPGARPLPADDHGAQRGLRVLPDRLPLLLRGERGGTRQAPATSASTSPPSRGAAARRARARVAASARRPPGAARASGRVERPRGKLIPPPQGALS